MKDLDFNRTLAKYLIGFGSALMLSVASYAVVINRVFDSNGMTMAFILMLASVQLVIQLVCFLHLGVVGRSRDRTITISFTIVMMLIIVVGSIWIMNNLDYRMNMSGEAMNEYMEAQNKKGF